jgi:AraC family transcriptional regulator
MNVRTDTQRDYAERILRVLLHIQAHLDEPLDLERLADVAHFSPFHFHRVFRGVVGESVKAHVRRLRLERAAGSLKSGSEPVTTIALDAGYESHEAFTRAFRALFGLSPSAYRRRQRALAPSGVHVAVRAGAPSFTPLVLEDGIMEARLVDREPLRVAFVRHTGPYDQVGIAWQQLCGWAGPLGLLGPESTMLGVSHDDPDVTPPEKLRYDACIPVGEDVEPAGNVGVQTVAGGRYAKTTHVGPYAGLALTYGLLCGQWLPAQDLEPAADRPALEFYLDDPETTPEAELRTEIYMPVKEG